MKSRAYISFISFYTTGITTRFVLKIWLTLIAFTSCNQAGTTHNKPAPQDSTIQPGIYQFSLADTLTNLFSRASVQASLLYDYTFKADTSSSVLFFTSGNILNKNNKNALVITCPTDTTYLIRLYKRNDTNWQLTDSLSGLDAYPSQLEVTFKDYNFDKQTDIFVQVTASQGWSLSRGHLLIVDPKTNKMINHTEARELANMEPDPTTKTVFSELSHGYNLKDQLQLTIFRNKWINGQLKTVSRKDTTL